ncbi:Hypothetical predicted protein [Marmota monax]|uniref:acid phosphatase n=1 Tax=Marmota monax TaxID=9995 RepID=A0A5E4D1I0_MARMO|nr:hypothetical protein GHT09_018763 [Marmota monax]VTJ88014.1 Hypothetical predicted protein [Marmota monax]
MAENGPKSVLFVCLGNICRSPIAEAVFRKLVTDQNDLDNWTIDSGAVSDWNVGRAPDPRAVNCLRNHGISTAHKARQVEEILFNFCTEVERPVCSQLCVFGVNQPATCGVLKDLHDLGIAY